MQLVTYNPDKGMMALTTTTFVIDKGGSFKKTVDITPLRLRQFNYQASTWDLAYFLQVKENMCCARRFYISTWASNICER